MDLKFDFMLNEHRYGVVEQAIFNLVLRGINSAQLISDLLWVFSNEVKATAIQRLVNNQVLRADSLSNKLSVSESVLSVIEACRNNTYTFELPDTLLSKMYNGMLWIEDRQVITSILRHMLPIINLDFLAASLSFCISAVRCENES